MKDDNEKFKEGGSKSKKKKLFTYKLPTESTYGTLFLSQYGDNAIYKKLRVIQFILIEVKKIDPKYISIEEHEIIPPNGIPTFLYRICNLRDNLVGYLGRNVKSDEREISYMVLDNSRFHWSYLEGFYELENFSRESVFDKIGVMISVPSINDFILFLAREKGFTFKGKHLKSGESVGRGEN